jgi:hypothetical protein
VCRRTGNDGGSTCERQPGAAPGRIAENVPQPSATTNQSTRSLPKVWTIQNFDGSTSVCRRTGNDGGSTCERQPGAAPGRIAENVPQPSAAPPLPVHESQPSINWGDVLVGALVLGAVVYAASEGAFSGGGGYSATVSDYSWSWDRFRDGSGYLIWRCRGEQTGQFAPSRRCAGRYQTDNKWPGPQLY